MVYMCYTYGFSHMTSQVEILWFLHVEYMGLCTYGIHVDLYTWNAYGFAHVKTIWKMPSGIHVEYIWF